MSALTHDGLPSLLARGTRTLARATAPGTRPLAGRRFFPLWAVVLHRAGAPVARTQSPSRSARPRTSSPSRCRGARKPNGCATWWLLAGAPSGGVERTMPLPRPGSSSSRTPPAPSIRSSARPFALRESAPSSGSSAPSLGPTARLRRGRAREAWPGRRRCRSRRSVRWLTVNAATIDRAGNRTSSPAAPLTMTGSARGAPPRKSAAPLATASAPTIGGPDERPRTRSGRRPPGGRRPGRAPAAARRSRPSRAAARKASTARRWTARSASGSGACGSNASARAARELPGRSRRALDDRRDLVERHAEHVVEHEREPLRRRQRLEHDEQRQPDGVGHHRVALRPGVVRRADDRLRKPGSGELLVARLAPTKRVEADPADDHGQPASQVIGPARIAAVEPQPGLLHGVLGLADRSEHAVAHRAQVPAVSLELLGEPLLSRLAVPAVRHEMDTCLVRLV